MRNYVLEYFYFDSGEWNLFTPDAGYFQDRSFMEALAHTLVKLFATSAAEIADFKVGDEHFRVAFKH